MSHGGGRRQWPRMRAAARAMVYCVVAWRGLGSQDTSAAALDRAVHRYQQARSLRAKFEQTLTNPATKSSRLASGEFLQRGAAHFALRFTEPAGDAIVNDGKVLWVYLPSTAKGQVMKMPGAAGAGLDFFSELLNTPRNHYAISRTPDETVGGSLAAVYVLTPKNTNAPFTRAKLWVSPGDGILRQLEAVEPSGLVRRLRFTSVRFDVPMPARGLSFIPPRGVRIVDQASVLGGVP